MQVRSAITMIHTMGSMALKALDLETPYTKQLKCWRMENILAESTESVT